MAFTSDADERTPLTKRARDRAWWRTSAGAMTIFAFVAMAAVGASAAARAARARPRVGIAPVRKVADTATYTLDVGCASESTKAMNEGFFANGATIVGAKLVHHNLGTTSFFEYKRALGMTLASDDGYRKKFTLTTNAVNFEYGFALVNNRGEYLYEIGDKKSPLKEAFTTNERLNCVQKYGKYFNRVRTMDKDPKKVDFAFGSCAAECPPPPPPSPPPPQAPPAPFNPTFFPTPGHTVLGNVCEGACAAKLSFTSTPSVCEAKCKTCTDCVGFAVDFAAKTCEFKSDDAIAAFEGLDWFARFGETPVPTPNKNGDGQTDVSLGITATDYSKEPCSACKAVFYEHYAPGMPEGGTGAVRATITTISTHAEPKWTNMAVVNDVSSIVITGSRNCRVVVDVDQCYNYAKTGSSGGAEHGGVYNYPMPTGNDNIAKAYVFCASDTTVEAEAIRCPTAPVCENCVATFWQHYAPGYGPTGAVSGSIGMSQITRNTNSPVWVSMVRANDASSITVTGSAECRVRTNVGSYEYSPMGTSGGSVNAGVYNYPMPTGNDNIYQAYMYCSAQAESNSVVA